MFAVAMPTSAVAADPNEAPASTRGEVVTPAYGLNVREVTVTRGDERTRLTPRSWSEIVHADPELLRHHQRARLLVGGIATLSVGALWLSISTAVAVDQYRERQWEQEQDARWGIATQPYRPSAMRVLFRWAVPTAGTLIGLGLTTVALRSRRVLRDERRRLSLAPSVGRRSAGLSIAGRF